MGLFDKIKDGAAVAAEKAKEAAEKAKNAVETAKANHEQKKAEAEQYRQEMEAKAQAKANEIVSAIIAYENDGSFLKNTTKEELFAFTKEFYDKILLPASSVNHSKIQMFPYIDEKQIAKFLKTWNTYNTSETAIIYLKAEGKQEIVITDSTLYFSIALEARRNRRYFF